MNSIYQQLFTHNITALCVINANNYSIVEANTAFYNLIGSEKKLPSFLQCISSVNTEAFVVAMQQIQATKQHEMKLHFLQADSNIIICNTYIQLANNSSNTVLIQLNNITETIALQEAYEKQQADKHKQIATATIMAQETERAQIGQELHDNINQILVTALLFVDYCIANKEHSIEKLGSAKQMIGQAIKEIRKLSKKLAPPSLDNIGLKQAIESIVATLQIVNNIQFELDIDEFDETCISDEQKLTLYRIFQEQINNVLKHAQATVVSISLNQHHNKAILIIGDNGIGSNVNTSSEKKGIGLQNIVARTQMLNGMVDIITQPNNGFTLKVQMPLPIFNA
jgi:two-component system, NarL family, sensor histidine kinase UhpB